MEPAGSEFWKATSVGGPLTAEMLTDAFKRIEEQVEPDPCRLGHHIVSPRGKEHLAVGGYARCASCLAVLQVREGRVEVLGF